MPEAKETQKEIICMHGLERNSFKDTEKLLGRMNSTKDKGKPMPNARLEGHSRRIPTQNAQDNEENDIRKLTAKVVKQRKRTIQILRDAIKALDTHEFYCAISKVAGTVAGVTGSVLVIIGSSLLFSGVGAFAGIPLVIVGGIVGGAGGLTTGISAVVEAALKKGMVEGVQEDLNLDRALSKKLSVTLQKAAKDPEYAKKWKIAEDPEFAKKGEIDDTLPYNVVRAIPGLAKVGVTNAAGAKVAMGLGRAATTTGLHVAGIALAAVVIPLDLTQMIISSIKIHKKDPSQVVKLLNSMADKLEHELKKWLVGSGYFRFIETTDKKWAYIVIDIVKKVKFDEKLKQKLTLEEIKKFGDIIHYGEGKVPKAIKQKMQDEWYSHKEDI